ncbi:transposase [Robertmurraya sp. GLU-23]
MARRARTWFPGAKYHITSRGIRKQPLFYDDPDRRKYLGILFETKERYDFNIHTYCLMSNHIHLQLETTKIPPGPIIKYLHSKYARYFNLKYDFSGHVFEKRYFHDIIDSPEHELDLSRYIHRNPLSAGMVESVETYPWSSYRAYIFNEHNPLVTKEQILSYFPEPMREHYLEFLMQKENYGSKEMERLYGLECL